MTLLEWGYFFIAIQIIHFVGTWKLYQKAGFNPIFALIPVYNAIVLFKIIKRPWWWTFLLFLPVINLIVFPVIWIETLRAFGKNSRYDALMAVFTLGFYIYTINYQKNTTYQPEIIDEARAEKESFLGSIVFAVIVATIVHTYVMQPYIIPTSSLEKSLLVGDFLFVSKFHYGARTPMTTVSLPMVHDTIPLAKVKSYISWPQLPYLRFPAIQKIKNNDIVVFNWPTDTVYFFGDVSNRHAYKPIDKKSNYVKRCVGIPGDVLEIKEGVVFINNAPLPFHDRQHVQYSYQAIAQNYLSESYLIDELKLLPNEIRILGQDNGNIAYFFTSLTDKAAERLRLNPTILGIEKNIFNKPDTRVFPHDGKWSQDEMGPIYIPKEGATIELNAENIPLYKRIIEEYEGNTFSQANGQILINGEQVTSYTFKQDYYWMMGDNRHNSEDSRYWGFVPHDHIVGKPVFIWMSIDQNAKGLKKIRTERLFSTVGGDGEPVSYFWVFILLVGGWFAFDYFNKKKKAKLEE